MILNLLAVTNTVWLIGTISTGVLLMAVTSAWNWAAMKANKADHDDVAFRLTWLEASVSALCDIVMKGKQKEE